MRRTGPWQLLSIVGLLGCGPQAGIHLVVDGVLVRGVDYDELDVRAQREDDLTPVFELALAQGELPELPTSINLVSGTKTPAGTRLRIEAQARLRGSLSASASGVAALAAGTGATLTLWLEAEHAPPDGGSPTDAGNPDAGNPDAGNPDAGNPDAGNPDAGNPDAGNPDAGNPDAGPQVDGGGPTDAGQPDGGSPGQDSGTADGGSPLLVELQTGGATFSAAVSTDAPVGAAPDALYVAAVSTKNPVPVDAVTGLGLTWTRLVAQCAGRNQTAVEVWVAYGSPGGAGVVTAAFASPPNSVVVAVARIAGASSLPSAFVTASANTLGPDGGCTGGVDSSAYLVDVTTSFPASLVVGSTAIRSRSATPGAGYAVAGTRYAGSGGEVAGIVVQTLPVALPSTVAVDGTLSTTSDWAVVGVVIAPP